MPGRLIVAPVVEGHGEERSVRTLFDRIGRELLGLEYVGTCKPVRKPRTALVSERSADLFKAVGLSALNLKAALDRDPVGASGLVLVLIDANGDCPAELGPELHDRAVAARSDVPVRVALAVREYETWFAAAADSLGAYLTLRDGEVAPAAPEASKQRKKWVEDRYTGGGDAKYSETVDQPSMTAAMDLAVVRDRCPSFARLCRVLEDAARPAPAEDE